VENIKIMPVDDSLTEKIAGFSKALYPQMNNLKDYIQWFSHDAPFLKGRPIPGLLALSDENEIVGCYMFNHQEWYFQGGKYEGFIGYDFFVKKDFRKTGTGALLLIQSLRKYKPFIGLGMSATLERLYTVMKVKEIGKLEKFLWVNRPLSSVNHGLKYLFTRNFRTQKPMRQEIFPKSLSRDEVSFNLLSRFPAESYKEYYDDSVVEFSRSAEFLDWRFFKRKNGYGFYYCQDGEYPLYFVVRPVSFKGLHLLLIVDYKIPLHEKKSWRLILRLSKKIARQLRFDGLITASSHMVFDNGLKSEGFFSIGRLGAIISTSANSLPLKPGLKSNIYVTMGDSDIDLNFGDKP